MNTEEIKILIDKYFRGETSLREEKILRDYFATGNYPENFNDVASLFGYFSTEKDITMNPASVEGLLKQLTVPQKAIFTRSRRMLYYIIGVAATVLFLIAIIVESRFGGSDRERHLASNKYTSREKQLAYIQVKNALGYVSLKLNRGLEPMSQIGKISKTTSQLGELSKFDEGLENVSKKMKKMESGVDDLSKLSKFNIIINN